LLGLIGAGGVARDALLRLGVTEDKVKAAVAEAMAKFESTFTKLITGPNNEQTH
jgi:Xaa-Pro aminopeptidase